MYAPGSQDGGWLWWRLRAGGMVGERGLRKLVLVYFLLFGACYMGYDQLVKIHRAKPL